MVTKSSIARWALAGVCALPIAAPLSFAAGNNDAAPGVVKQQSKLYIVQMVDPPAVAYTGGIAGLKATKPNRGQKIDPYSRDVIDYSAYLTAKHDNALRSVGGAKKAYSYKYTFNGFAAELSAAQAEAMKLLDDVVAVNKDELRSLDTASTPDFLHLSGEDGFYALTKALGEGVIIGMVDSGIWPESLSFSDRIGTNGNASKDGKLSYLQLPGWHGKCVPGEAFNAAQCNQKLIGAQYYNAGWGGNAEIDRLFPFEFNSPRDWDGHGTHTSSTAGGNRGVPTSGDATIFGPVNGIAPRARIATYKVCWADEGTGGGCFGSDSVAAIDQAVADGVDVINFSISGSQTSFLDAVEVAFMFAADAGVFIATSAGNAGPTVSTVAHPGPWLTTVAAGTHNRDGRGSITLGNGNTYNGASVAKAVASKPTIRSSDAGLPGMPASQVAQCWSDETGGGSVAAVPGTPTGPRLDPAKIAGKIVVCDRGANARIDKSLAVLKGGGSGMILVNVSPNSINADFHFVPTVHLSDTDGAVVKTYAASAGATASIAQATIIYNAPAPTTAAFSSRGPLRAGNGDLLKPDLIAPGQDIIAAVSPVGNNGRDFDVYSGTSMSSPHVAGLGALFKELYPSWSPMAIKSALMTTGTDVLDGPNTNPLVIFRQGAGHVRPVLAANPGLVFDSAFDDWRGFLRSQQLCTFCFGTVPAPVFDTSDFNGASIAIGDMAGIQTVTRRVTNVGNGSATYSAAYTGMTGFDVLITPASLTLAKGETKSFTVKFTRNTATLAQYTGGQLTWSDGEHNVRIPMVVRPVSLAAPTQVSGTGGAINYNVTFGYTGAFSATPRGLIPAVVTPGVVPDDPTNSTCSLTSPNAVIVPVVIPAGTTYARFSLFDTDVNPGSDIDLCVFNSASAQVGSSGSGTSAEEVNLVNPAADTYRVVVQGWGVVGSSPFKLHTWLLDSSNAGNMTVSAPASAIVGTTGAINLTFSGLVAATKYLGSVFYSGIAGLPNPTIVRVDTP